MADFKSCLNEEKYKSKVEQDKAEGEANGVFATPTFFINGFKVEGSQPFSILQDLIEQALNGNLEKQNG